MLKTVEQKKFKRKVNKRKEKKLNLTDPKVFYGSVYYILYIKSIEIYKIIVT